MHPIERRLQELAMSKAKLCRMAEIAPQTLNRMLNGEITRGDRKGAVAKALGVKYEDLFSEDHR